MQDINKDQIQIMQDQLKKIEGKGQLWEICSVQFGK